MTFDPSTWTWTCNICGDVRPDAAISVNVREYADADGNIVPGAGYNERYCNDRPACIAAAAKPGPYQLGRGTP
jgi:hypothetical protein